MLWLRMQMRMRMRGDCDGCGKAELMNKKLGNHRNSKSQTYKGSQTFQFDVGDELHKT